jgi:hypothetical protein
LSGAAVVSAGIELSSRDGHAGFRFRYQTQYRRRGDEKLLVDAVSARQIEESSIDTGDSSMDTVPFMLSNVFGGFANADGLLRNEGAQLCLEYQVSDGLVGVLKSGVKQLCIPMENLVSVTLTKGWFGLGHKIVIQVDKLELLEDMPEASQGQIRLSIARKDHEAAEAFVERLYQHEDSPPQPART